MQQVKNKVIMKTYFKFTIVLFLIIQSSVVFSQNWQWAKPILGTGGNIEVNQTVIDNQDNIYVCGFFSNEIEDANGSGVLTSGNKDLFLSKYNPDGTLLWMRLGQGSNLDAAKDLVVDENNNVYLMGETKDDITFADATTPITLSITSAGKFDVFVVKYDSDGNLQWARTAAGGSNHVRSGGLFYDELTQKVIVTGKFKTDIIFPGQAASPTSTPAFFDYFIAQYDPSTGDYSSSQLLTVDAAGGSCNFFDIKRHGNNYYFLGVFAGTVNLATSQILSSSTTDFDIVIYKTDLNFNEIWNKKIQSTSADFAYSIQPTNIGVHVAGYSHSGLLNFESTTPEALTLDGTSYDGFSALYDHAGELLNAQEYTSTRDIYIYEVFQDVQNVIYTGSFEDSLIVNNDTLISTTLTESDVFWAVSDENNVPLYADQTIGSGSDKARSTLVDSNGDLYLAGSYKSDPFILYSEYGSQDNLSPSTLGFSSGFLAKYTLCDDYDVRIWQDSTSCPNTADGLASAIVFKDETAGADTISYEWDFLWSNTNWTTDSLRDSISNLEMGRYFLTLTNKYGCTYTDSIDIVSHRILETRLTDLKVLDCGLDTLSSDTVFASFGVRPYTYLWSGTLGTDSVAHNLPVGTHSVKVTDDCGTEVTDYIQVAKTLRAQINTHTTIIACALESNGEAWISYDTTNTGMMDSVITFNWENSLSTDYIASDLSIGLHHVTITDGCTEIIDSVNVVNLPTMNIGITDHTDISCVTESDGTADILVTGGVQPYTFNWSSTETTEDAFALSEGWAYVTVTDACVSVIDSVLIGITPSIDFTITANHETCTGGNGQAFVNVSGGSGAYSYKWDTVFPISATPFSNNDTIFDLSADTYYVEVSDACGSKVDSIILTNSPDLQLALSSHSLTLFCDTSTNGSITAFASNGVAPYTYAWSNGGDLPTTNSLIVDVDYQYITVTDACSNSIVDSFKVGYAPQLISFAEFMSDATCLNTNDGQATVISTGGVQPYSYSWSNSTSTSNLATDLSVGTQYITVSDYCGDAIDSVEISHLPTLNISLTGSGEQCPNDSLANITVSILNGIAPFTYDWGTSSPLDTNYIDSLKSGMHYVTVTDFCNIAFKSGVEITSSDPLVGTLNQHDYLLHCSSDLNGIGMAIASDGLPTYSYLWSNGETTASVDNLGFGQHYVTVSDMCLDTIVDSIYVSYLPNLDVEIETTDPLCFNEANGTIQLNITQGIQPYLLEWSDFANGELMHNSLTHGTYNFSVTDGCGTYTGAAQLNNPDSIIIIETIIEESRSNNSDGSILLNIIGGTSPYNFLWSNREYQQDLINITSGTYSIVVTDFNNCSSSASYTLETSVETIEAVDAFTPNGDGVNEDWKINNIEKFTDCEITIFNQWGNIVFESTGYDEPWDGTSGGNKLAAAVYYYIIDLKDGSDPKSGSITLIR